MTEQENTAVIGDDEIIDEIEESEQGGNGHNREVKRRRRLTPEETRILSEIYEHTQKPNSVLRNRLAQELGMSSRQIQIWFQNRRAKIKRDVNDPMGTDSASKLYYPNDPTQPYYVQYPPGTISNSIQGGATRPMGMLNIASKSILPVTSMNPVYQQKQYPMGMTQSVNGYPIPVTAINYPNQTQSSVPLQASQQGNLNYGYAIRSQGVQSGKQIQGQYVQSTAAGQTRIMPGNTMVPVQSPQQPIRTANQLSSSPVPPMYTQPASQVPIYSTTANSTYQTNATQLSPLQNMSYPGQKNQQINSRNSIYMNYPGTQGTTQGSQSNVYMSNVYDMNKRTTASTNMVYSQNVIPATNIVNSGIPSTVALGQNNTTVINPSPLSRPVTTVQNQTNSMNKMVQNPLNTIMMSPDNKTDLNKKVPITTIVSSIPSMSNVMPNQAYPGGISKLASTGMPTSPIKAIINSSINSKVAAKAASAAAALKQENAMNQNVQNLYNMNNNIIMSQSNISLNNDKIQNPIASANKVNPNLSKPIDSVNKAENINSTVVTNPVKQTINSNVINPIIAATSTTAPVPSSKINTTVNNENINNNINTKIDVNNSNNIKKESIEENDSIKENDSIGNIKNNNNPLNDESASLNSFDNENTENINATIENKSNESINAEKVTKIDNIKVLDSMLYNPNTKLESSTEQLNANDQESNKDQSNKFLKDYDTLYDNNDTMKWLEEDANWNQATQLSQFPLPDEDKKNQKEGENKDLGSLNDLNTNDSSLNDNNNQLWLSDDIDYLLQSDNFQV